MRRMACNDIGCEDLSFGAAPRVGLLGSTCESNKGKIRVFLVMFINKAINCLERNKEMLEILYDRMSEISF